MEVTRDQYARLSELASTVFYFISGIMEDIRPPGGRHLPDEWHELHDLMQLANVILTTAGRYRDRAELSADPIDLTVAACTCDPNRPGHRVGCAWLAARTFAVFASHAELDPF